MWLLTPFGILMPALRPAKTIEPGDERQIQVRARHTEYLDIFRERYCPEMGESIHFPEQDYQWKAYCTHQQLADATAKMMLDIDFIKFKPEAEAGLKLHYKTGRIMTGPTAGQTYQYVSSRSGTSRWGLPAKLARQLHDCYNSLWGTMLVHGDKTSSYDKGWGSSTWSYDPKTHKAEPALCRDGAHWYPMLPAVEGKQRERANVCVDCGRTREAADVLTSNGLTLKPKTQAPGTGLLGPDWLPVNGPVSNSYTSDGAGGFIPVNDSDEPQPGDWDYVSDTVPVGYTFPDAVDWEAVYSEYKDGEPVSFGSVDAPNRAPRATNDGTQRRNRKHGAQKGQRRGGRKTAGSK